MKKTGLSFLFSFAMLFSTAQTDAVREINRMNTFNEALAPLRFLASDELMGRATTRSEIHIAARYISEQFYWPPNTLQTIRPSRAGQQVTNMKAPGKPCMQSQNNPGTYYLMGNGTRPDVLTAKKMYNAKQPCNFD